MSKATEKSYEVGQVFKRVSHDTFWTDVGDLLIFSRDDGSYCPKFLHLTGKEEGKNYFHNLDDIVRVYPPELEVVEEVVEESTDVTIMCEGKETTISRESAKELNLIQENYYEEE